MITINEERFEQVVNEALAKVEGERRWQKAIRRAAEELLTNPYWHVQDDGSLLMLSSTSSNLYEANGVCQCSAFINHQPCKHRAAKRLLERYNEITVRCEGAPCVASERVEDSLEDSLRVARSERMLRLYHSCPACGEQWSCDTELCDCDDERPQICSECRVG